MDVNSHICLYLINIWLVVTGTCFIFHILGTIIQIDEIIFVRGVGIPPTRYDVFDNCRAKLERSFVAQSLAEGMILKKYQDFDVKKPTIYVFLCYIYIYKI